MTTRRLATSLLAVMLVCAGCGRLTGSGPRSGPGEPITHPTGANDLVLRWETTGGFVAPISLLQRFPSFSLYGDGTLITEGAQTEIYPGPALPPLLEQRISEEGVQAILVAAKRAGLLDGDASYTGCAADVPSTVFTANAGGRTSVVTVEALGMQCPRDRTVRTRLATFLGKLANLESWLPAGSIGQATPFAPSAFRLFVQPYRAIDASVHEPVSHWPGPSLAAMDGPVANVPGVSCGVVDGADAPSVLQAARSANQLTPWSSEGGRYAVTFHPLLPGETGC